MRDINTISTDYYSGFSLCNFWKTLSSFLGACHLVFKELQFNYFFLSVFSFTNSCVTVKKKNSKFRFSIDLQASPTKDPVSNTPFFFFSFYGSYRSIFEQFHVILGPYICKQHHAMYHSRTTDCNKAHHTHLVYMNMSVKIFPSWIAVKFWN